MKRLDRIKRRALGTDGSSMVYVLFLVALLSVFACGYMAASGYRMKAAVSSGHYMEAQLAAKTIHASFCEAVSSGRSSAMNRLWNLFEEDVRRTRQEYDRMMGEKEDEVLFTQYLKQALGDKEYVMRGIVSGEEEEGMDLEITLEAKPLEKMAYVHTRVMYNGFHFSMKADILFDNRGRDRDREGENLWRRRREGVSEEPEAASGHSGVYRYYEDENGDP